MTLLDLCRLLKHHLALVIALPIMFALVCFAYLSISSQSGAKFSAASRIVVSTHVQDVAGIAASEVRAVLASKDNDSGIEVKSSADVNTKTITITVIGTNENEAVETANDLAETVSAEAKAFVPDNTDDPFNARVEKAVEANTNDSGKGIIKYLLVALLAGLFTAICIVAIIDRMKRPVKNIEGVQDVTGLPVLEILPITDNGERLLANVRFAAKKDDLKSVCVVPIGNGNAGKAAATALVAAAGDEVKKDGAGIGSSCSTNLSILNCDSLSHGIEAAYIARRADATILAVREWEDSLNTLESDVAELRLAEANVVGIVFDSSND